MNPKLGRPEDLIIESLPVPPVCLRPSVAMHEAQGTNQDDLTMKLAELCYINVVIRDAMEKGQAARDLMVGLLPHFAMRYCVPLWLFVTGVVVTVFCKHLFFRLHSSSRSLFFSILFVTRGCVCVCVCVCVCRKTGIFSKKLVLK
jgi:RNA polymerase Rpb1, domain 1